MSCAFVTSLTCAGCGSGDRSDYQWFTRESSRDGGYRMDVDVEDCVLLELKSVERLTPIDEAQLLTYLRLSGIKIVFLVNFNVPVLKDGIVRRAL